MKGRLESKLMVILPFGGRHADAVDNLETLAARRFENKANALRLTIPFLREDSF
jgi:hypothetical protein